jgi:hypothetical protein
MIEGYQAIFLVGAPFVVLGWLIGNVWGWRKKIIYKNECMCSLCSQKYECFINPEYRLNAISRVIKGMIDQETSKIDRRLFK